LPAARAKVDDNVQNYNYGRFAWAADPEGNRFEPWQPLPARIEPAAEASPAEPACNAVSAGSPLSDSGRFRLLKTIDNFNNSRAATVTIF
jgi:hypothetical protein